MARPLLKRYEIKYVIPEHRVEGIRRHLRPYMQLDSFSAKMHDGNYPISSLYLDTPNRRFAKETRDGIKMRFKTRVRAYDDRSDGTVFLEVKHRDGEIIRKTRAAVDRRIIGNLPRRRSTAPIGSTSVPGPSDATDAPKKIVDAKTSRLVDDFQTRIARWRLRPTMVVRYDREAFQGVGGAPVRITFDRHLRRHNADGWEVPVHDTNWMPVCWNPDPTALVLEIKYSGEPPRWVRQMIHKLEIRQTGHGKYALSIDDDADGPPPRGAAGIHWVRRTS